MQHCPPQSSQPSNRDSLNTNRDSINTTTNSSRQQSARERLFGSVNSNSIYNQQQQQNQLMNSIDMSDQINNRKIAMVKPELRGSCEKYYIYNSPF